MGSALRAPGTIVSEEYLRLRRRMFAYRAPCTDSARARMGRNERVIFEDRDRVVRGP